MTPETTSNAATASELSRVPPRGSSVPPRPHEASARPAWVAPVVGTLLVLGLATFSVVVEAFSVSGQDATLWAAAESDEGEDAWQAYVAWSDAIRERGGARSMLATELTQIWTRAPEAADHVLVARAQTLVTNSDWPALCALRSEHLGTAVESVVNGALAGRLDHAILAYSATAQANTMRTNALEAITAALTEVRDRDPCADTGVLRVRHSIDVGSDDFDRRLPSGATVRDLLEDEGVSTRVSSLIDTISEDMRTGLDGAYGLSGVHDEGTTSRTRLIVEVNAVLHAHDHVLNRAGVELPGLALRVSVRFFVRHADAAMPEDPEYQASSELSVPASAHEALTRSASADTAAEAYAAGIDDLYAQLTQRVREELGLAPWSGPSSPYYDCADAELLPVARRVRGTTRGALDVTYGTCSPEYARDRRAAGDVCQDCPAAPESPEFVYRLIVPERSRMAVQVFAEARPVVTYVRSECAASTNELGCTADGSPVSALLDPGVYYVFVDGTGGTSGRFELQASLHDPTAEPHACESATALDLDSDVLLDTSSGLDHTEGSCGGVGAPERIYTLEVAATSLLRCTRTSAVGGVVYVRSECGEPSTELVCSAASATPLEMTLEPGRYFVVIDGQTLGDRGRHTLHCELVPGRPAAPD